jgi:SAM-dependent methyltransferase
MVVRQCRKPFWWPGQLFARLMNSSHRHLTEWGLAHVTFEPRDKILDVGCGGGMTIQRLLKLATEGEVFGVDYSEASVSVARKTNATSIAAGRAHVQRASVSSLPFPPDTFDVVTAVETHYYWPNLRADLEEIRRVLKSGGRVVIIAEAYRGKRFGAAEVLAMRVLGGGLLTLQQHRDVLIAAGYSNADVFEERKKGWMCIVATKAAMGPHT